MKPMTEQSENNKLAYPQDLLLTVGAMEEAMRNMRRVYGGRPSMYNPLPWDETQVDAYRAALRSAYSRLYKYEKKGRETMVNFDDGPLAKITRDERKRLNRLNQHLQEIKAVPKH